jgi:hypothetical protein
MVPAPVASFYQVAHRQRYIHPHRTAPSRRIGEPTNANGGLAASSDFPQSFC